MANRDGLDALGSRDWLSTAMHAFETGAHSRGMVSVLRNVRMYDRCQRTVSHLYDCMRA